jgi:16S rRNA (adenine1518-N6/adenine1519-N6)-dimethyltransferase
VSDPWERHQPKKSLGQNFLVDPNLQRKIVQALDPSPTNEVLEIGPGTGALTRHLVDTVRRLTLVELDTQLAGRLAEEYRDRDSITVLQRDILSLDLTEVTDDVSRLKVIGNIPYNITTPIIFHLLERPVRPRLIVLMMQREVADRILASPGSKVYGALAVGVQSVADVNRVLQIRRTAFRPMPEVDSTVVRITPHFPRRLDAGTETALRTLTRAAFGQRRKQFQRILRDAFGVTPDDIEKLSRVTGFDLTARPEVFDPQEFIRLAESLRQSGRL